LEEAVVHSSKSACAVTKILWKHLGRATR